MPGFDGTGPMGQGPFTGRGLGYCAIPLKNVHDPSSPAYPVDFSYGLPVYPRRGFRARRFFYPGGFGRGRGRRFVMRGW